MFSKISKTPLIHDHFHIVAIFTRRSCYNLFWKLRIIHYKLSTFFQCSFTSRTEIIMVVCSFEFFSRNHFLRRDLIFQWRKWLIFSGVIYFLEGRAPYVGCTWFDETGAGVKKIHRVGDTPIIPLPTMPNPGLCCNRVKKKQMLQNIPENFIDTFHWSILKTFPRSVQIYLMVDFKMLLDWSSH